MNVQEVFLRLKPHRRAARRDGLERVTASSGARKPSQGRAAVRAASETLTRLAQRAGAAAGGGPYNDAIIVLSLIALLLAAASGLAAQQFATPTPALSAQIREAEARVTKASPRSIAEAEGEGAAYPRIADTEKSVRTCTIIRPEQIVLPPPAKAMNPYVQSGEFEAVSISFGWDLTYEQAKMPLVPRYRDAIGRGLRIRVIALGEPREGTTYALDDFNANSASPWTRFFASWPRFPTPGRWLMLVTAGANWGCFVLDRPVKAR